MKPLQREQQDCAVSCQSKIQLISSHILHFKRKRFEVIAFEKWKQRCLFFFVWSRQVPLPCSSPPSRVIMTLWNSSLNSEPPLNSGQRYAAGHGDAWWRSGVWLIPLRCYHLWQRVRRASRSDKDTQMLHEICRCSGYLRVVLSTVCNTTLPITAGLFSSCVSLCSGRRHRPHRRLSVRTHKGGGHPVEEWSQCSRPAEREPLLLPHLWPLLYQPCPLAVAQHVRNRRVSRTQCTGSWNPAAQVSAD